MRGRGTRRAFLAGLVCLLLAVSWPPGGTAVSGRADTGEAFEIPEARRLLEAGQFEKAEQILERYLAANRQGPESAYLLLVETLRQLNRLDRAVSVCELGLEHIGEPAALERLYVDLTQQQGNQELFKTRLKRQLQRRPDSLIFQKALGYFLLKENLRDRRAAELLTRAATQAPADPEARFLYGQWACLNNKNDLCIVELEEALRLSPPNDYAFMQICTMLAMAERNRNNPEPAAEWFRKGLSYNRKLSPPDAVAAYQYVKFLLETSRDNDAMVLVDEILRWSPAFGPARYERARALSRAGKLEEAAVEGEIALQTLERDDASLLPAAHAFMARTYFALKRITEARFHQAWIEEQGEAGPHR
jgi:tetratricopeptide (TPR) repeat protein